MPRIVVKIKNRYIILYANWLNKLGHTCQYRMDMWPDFTDFIIQYDGDDWQPPDHWLFEEEPEYTLP